MTRQAVLLSLLFALAACGPAQKPRQVFTTAAPATLEHFVGYSAAALVLPKR